MTNSNIQLSSRKLEGLCFFLINIPIVGVFIKLFLFFLALPVIGAIILLIWFSGNGEVFVKKDTNTIEGLLFFRSEQITNNTVRKFFKLSNFDSLPHMFQMVTGELKISRTSQGEWEFRKCQRNSDGWLRTGSFLIPREYREPMLGDLIEDREQMRATGKSFVWIEFVTLFQLFIACISRPKLWISGLVGWFSRSFLS